MNDGRTVWQAQDAAWWRRERPVLLGERFGSEGPAIANWLECEAKAQNNGGRVKAGYSTAARGSFVAGGADRAREIVAYAVEIGFLEDFAEGDRTFTATIAAYQSDQGKGRDTIVKAARRADTDTPGQARTGPDKSVAVRIGPGAVSETGEERREQENGNPTARDSAQQVFDEWVKATGRTGQTDFDDARRRVVTRALKVKPLADVVDAVRGVQLSTHHMSNRQWSELKVVLRDVGQIEHFRDLHRTRQPAAAGTSESDRLAAAYANGRDAA